MAVNYPQYEVVSFNYLPAGSSGYLILNLLTANSSWQIPALGGANGFSALVTSLSLHASQNPALYPFSYTTGAPWANAAAALAAAQADFATITAARDAAAQAAALTATVPNQYVTIGLPVSGPG